MSERAYIQPKAIIGVLQYYNPNEEVLAANKTLVPTDSPIQKLDAGNNNYRVILPDPLYCEGMIFHIINSTGGAGTLQIYNNTQTFLIATLEPNEIIQIICINGEWGGYTPHIPATGANSLYYTKSEIDNMFANIRFA